MQGRLSEPVNNKIQHFPLKKWKEEFYIASKIGLSSIEWVYEYEKIEQNPLDNESSLELIKEVSAETGICINSVVADYFMESKLFNEKEEVIEENINKLENLINACTIVDIPIVEIPLVDQSSLKNCKDLQGFVSRISPIVEIASKKGIKVSLETDLDPFNFKTLLEMFLPHKVYVNFDMGNSAANGFNPKEEIQLLSKDIINVHIKDRVLGGSTVPLGEGNTDFSEVFSQLQNVNYSGDFILQAARQDIGKKSNKDFIKTILQYIKFLEPYISL